jgi:hypothetical protein
MSVIYKISCKDLNVKEIYVGSTIDFKQRKYQHKTVCYNENSKDYNKPLYYFIRNNGGWQNWSMNKIEEIESVDKEIIKKYERKYIEENRDIVLNKDLPGRTREEWYQDNKEKICEQRKERYENNKEKEHERVKIYRENNKEKIKERVKIYQKINREKINRKRRERYQNKKNDSK